MKKEIIANSKSDETRVAVLEDSKLADLFIERPESSKLAGNVYKGTVETLVPGISSAFVNIGLEKNGYLYIADAIAGAPEIYNPKGLNPHIDPNKKYHFIDKILKRDTNIMVQVIKEPISTKGVKLTMDISLPGKYLVFMPFQNHPALSKSIINRKERDRLKKILDEVTGEQKGFIVRTEAEGASKEELHREVRYLYRLWNNLLKKYQSAHAPALIHKDLGLTFQMVRDVLNDDVAVFWIDSKKEYEDVVGFADMVAPEHKNKIKCFDNKTPIFNAFNIEDEIINIRKAKIKLPSGGSIIIQEAESLCAVDVNTGKFKGSESHEDTIYRTNKEAALE
ncbi:MAG: hypothetical protein GF384_05865, partial [Elusimicrobia bacterium]|nr:hypothetical protein [Elusimicrobiota bacterium]MBD3412284.1 hypothetical protein [Elusimicrobiota bacterium]